MHHASCATCDMRKKSARVFSSLSLLSAGKWPGVAVVVAVRLRAPLVLYRQSSFCFSLLFDDFLKKTLVLCCLLFSRPSSPVSFSLYLVDSFLTVGGPVVAIESELCMDSCLGLLGNQLTSSLDWAAAMVDVTNICSSGAVPCFAPLIPLREKLDFMGREKPQCASHQAVAPE